MSLRPIYCAVSALSPPAVPLANNITVTLTLQFIIVTQSHQSSRMIIYEKENFMGRSVEVCDDYPSLRAMGWMWPEVGSMHVQCGA